MYLLYVGLLDSIISCDVYMLKSHRFAIVVCISVCYVYFAYPLAIAFSACICMGRRINCVLPDTVQICNVILRDTILTAPISKGRLYRPNAPLPLR